MSYVRVDLCLAVLGHIAPGESSQITTLRRAQVWNNVGAPRPVSSLVLQRGETAAQRHFLHGKEMSGVFYSQ